MRLGRCAAVVVALVVAAGGCTGGDSSETTDPPAPTPLAETLTDVVIDLGIARIDRLGAMPTDKSRDTAAEVGLVRLVAGAGSEDAARFETAALQDVRRQLSAAMREGDRAEIHDATGRAGRVAGLIAGANTWHGLDEAGPDVSRKRLAGDLEAEAANDAETIQRTIVVQAALDADELDVDELPAGGYARRAGRVVLDPGLDSEDLSDAFFSIDLDAEAYHRGWDLGFAQAS